jgi:hypothetical protein
MDRPKQTVSQVMMISKLSREEVERPVQQVRSCINSDEFPSFLTFYGKFPSFLSYYGESISN